jgi:hypothetical protein
MVPLKELLFGRHLRDFRLKFGRLYFNHFPKNLPLVGIRFGEQTFSEARGVLCCDPGVHGAPRFLAVRSKLRSNDCLSRSSIDLPSKGRSPPGEIKRIYIIKGAPSPRSNVDARAEALARQIWGYFKGDSTGGTTAMQLFDNNKSLGGPAHIIELCRKAMNPQTNLRASGAHITVADALQVDKDALAKVTGVDVEECLSITVAEDIRPSLDIVVRFSELIREVQLRRISVESCVAAIMNLHLVSSDCAASAPHSWFSSSATEGSEA